MSARACLFPTAFGTCGLAWTERGIRAVQLPEAREALTLRRLQRGLGAQLSPAPLPGPIIEATRRLQLHLEGSRDHLQDIPLDLDGVSEFSRQVYQQARCVRPGQTTTYRALAGLCQRPGAARAVGHAMATNPVPLLVPCHRVLAADGALGGFSAHGAQVTKLRLLSIEGADLSPVAEAGVRELGRRDLRLRALIRRVGRFRLDWAQRQDRFTALAEAIVHQQVSMAAGASIFGRLLALAGDPVSHRPAAGSSAKGRSAGLLEPERLLKSSEAQLRSAGLSRQKVSYLLDLSTQVQTGRLPLERLDRMDDEQVVATLTRVKGIGRWSAEMFLIFRLGRLDVLPVADLGLRKGVQRVFELRTLPTAARIQKLAASWRPFRSIATWYLWRSLEAGGLAA